MGGSGAGDRYRKRFSSSGGSASKAPQWVKDDFTGAGMGMVTWAFSAFFGPVAIIGFAYGAVSGALTGSMVSKG